MLEFLLITLGLPLLILLCALAGWGLIRGVYEVIHRGDPFKKYSNLLMAGLSEIALGYIFLVTGCEPKHLQFGDCFPVPPWAGHLAIVCGILTMLSVAYLVWSDRKGDR